MTKPTVWVVTPELHPFGGTERCLAEELERWHERFTLRLYTMRLEGVRTEGICVRKIPSIPGPHLLRYVWWLGANHVWRWWDSRRLGEPDVVLSPGINCMDADVIGVHILFEKYWKEMSGKVLTDLRSLRDAPRAVHRMLYWRLLRTLEKRLYSAAPTVVWAMSQRNQQALAAMKGDFVPLIPHGVDAAAFSPESREQLRHAARAELGIGSETVALLVGNDYHSKGVAVALDSLRMWPSKMILAVAGDMDFAAVRDAARREKVLNRVAMWPHRADVMTFYAASDLIVVPSREDAFSMPTLEALACGLPAVVSARAGVSDLLEDGRHALVLRDPEDAVELAQHVCRIAQEPALAAQLAHQGRKLAEEWSWEQNAAATGNLIEHAASRPRFLVLSPSPRATGGVERVSRELATVLSEISSPERVGILSVWDRGDRCLAGRVLYAGRRSGRGRTTFAHKTRYLLTTVATARRWRRRLIIWCCHPHLGVVAWASAKASGAPYAVWCHGHEAWGPLRRTVRFALRRADVIFAPSEFTARQVEKALAFPKGRVLVLPHPVSFGLLPDRVGERPPHGDRSGVLSVARLSREETYKGIDRLLYAWPRVLERSPIAHLTVVGDGSDRLRLERIASLLGVAGHVGFLGQVSDVELQHAYRRAAVFALPARCRLGRVSGGEGFGLVLAEANLASLPVVAGKVGPASEVVLDRVTGMLVDPENLEEIADAICQLLENPERASRLGSQGEKRVRSKFSNERFRLGIQRLVDHMLTAVEV